MSIAPIATANANAASGNPSSTHGLTLLSGDVLVATINANGAGNTVTDNNGSTAFTFDDFGENPDTARFYVFHRVCGSSEPSTYNFTLGSSARWSLVLQQFRYVDPMAVWDVAPSASTRATGTLAATAVASAITINTNGALGLTLMGDDAFPTTTTFSSIDNSYGGVVSVTGQQYQATAIKQNLSTGSTGATTITSSANVSYVIYQVALKPLIQLEQSAFRFRNDDGSETTATWAAAANTNINLGRGLTRRVRVQSNATGDPASYRRLIEYRAVGDDGWRELKS